MAVMRSREFTEGFIRDENLLPELFHELWDPQAGKWRNKEAATDPCPSFQDFRRDAVRHTSRSRRLGHRERLWRDPAKAAEWANALVARLNAEMRERAIESTNLSVSYLEKELAATSTIETRLAINRLMEAQINQRMLANVTQEYAFRVIDRALPPEPDDAVGPSKLVLLALGPTVGLIFGVFLVLVVNVLRSRRKSQAAV